MNKVFDVFYVRTVEIDNTYFFQTQQENQNHWFSYLFFIKIDISYISYIVIIYIYIIVINNFYQI